MDYIVFDLEWNQCPQGKKRENHKLPFEIIEIGAIKLNSKREVIDEFHKMIKPKVYKWIHAKTREVIHVDYKNLMDGDAFPDAAKEFLTWCGEDYAFCSWGALDLMELQRNMKYYKMEELLPGPIRYYDIQKLFGITQGDRRIRKSLEDVVHYYSIHVDREFHEALADAFYTAKVFQQLEQSVIEENYSIDVYQNPKTKKEEVHLSYKTYDKYVSREFPDKERAMRDREVNSTRCPKCQKPARRRVRWFAMNSRHYYSVSECEQHGYVKGKIRMKKTENGTFYVVKTLKNIGPGEVEEIKEKQMAIRKKRQERRHKEKGKATR